MRKMFTMVEVSKVPIMGKEEENEIELSLDLSIGGGRYGKSENVEKIQEKTKHFPFQGIFPRSDIYREEDKLRINANGFMEDKQFLEAQQFEARVKDREIREKDGVLEELSRKNKENELNLCLFSGNKSKEKMKNQCLFTETTEYVKNEGINCNWAPQPSSSAISDSHKGGSDTGSYSSCLNSNQQFGLPEQKPGPSSVQLTTIPSPLSEKSKPDSWSNRTTNNTSSMSHENTSTPKPVNHQNGDMASFHHRMPCVSTKGNGPNGKTISGILYKYSKSEVSIVCVCHGSLFTPAEFVEHAGGVDISNPLRHITIVPSSLG